MNPTDLIPGAARQDDDTSLTQSLRKLTMPLERSADEIEADGERRHALLFSRDTSAAKWAPRWLAQTGFDVEHHRDGERGLALARTTRSDVLLVDAGLRDEDGEPLYATLIGAADIRAPVIVLCSSNRDTIAALDAGADEVVRKPFEWRLVALRARQALDHRALDAEIRHAKRAANEALELANSARLRLRSREAYEPVTGLPNKTRFLDLVRRGMKAVDRGGQVLAVFVIGFNRFRLVAEAMGQERADLVLNQIGVKLRECLRNAGPGAARPEAIWTAAAASLDGARFGVMLTCSDGNGDLADMQQRLLASLSQPVEVAAQIVHLSACIGVALYPQDGDEADRLVQRAENAMREAQSHGGGFRHYCEATDAAAARKLRMEHMLHEALDRDGLRIAYQPICRTADGRIVGAEALLRWPQADGGFISPTEFAPIAEESGLMTRIGRMVLDRACARIAEWNRDGAGLGQMCVNVSKVQLLSGDFVGVVAAAIDKHGIEPSSLELELSERGVLSHTAGVSGYLQALRELGVRLSIDDFGTGDSAISYLKELPVDVLKIDRSYISGIPGDGKDVAIVSAMIALGERMGLDVIAEGVETELQLETLRELGCGLFQGFLVSKPVFADAFRRLLPIVG